MTLISIGPPSSQWVFDPSTRTYDLSPNSKNKITIPTSQGPEKAFFTISPEKSALIIVDMQNFFLDEKCMVHPNGLKAVEPTIRTIQKCREVGIRVIWLNWGLSDIDLETMPAGVQRGFMKDILRPSSSSILKPYTGLGSDLGDSKGRCLFAGSWNADIYPRLKALVLPEDIHCAKNRMSGLWNDDQPLFKVLKREGIENCLFAGVNTDQCVGGTLTDAYNRGWGVVLVDDCCGTTTVGGREVWVHNVGNSYGFVTDSQSIVSAMVE